MENLRLLLDTPDALREVEADEPARTAIAAILLGTAVMNTSRLLAAGVTADDFVKAAVGKPSNPAGALQAMLLRRFGPPLIEPDLDRIPEGPVRDSMARMVTDPFNDIGRASADSVRSTYLMGQERVDAYRRATMFGESTPLSTIAAGLTFAAALRPIFYLVTPFLLEAPLPFAIHAEETITLLQPLPVSETMLFLTTQIARNLVRKTSGTGFLLLEREIGRGGTDAVIARGTTKLAIGSNIHDPRWTAAPSPFGEPKPPFSGTMRTGHINDFASASEDFQSPHISEEAAFALSGQRRRLVHGMMTFGRALSLGLGEIPALRRPGEFVPFTIRGEFLGPVFVDDRLEFALAPAAGALGAVLVRNQDLNLVFRATFTDPSAAPS